MIEDMMGDKVFQRQKLLKVKEAIDNAAVLLNNSMEELWSIRAHGFHVKTHTKRETLQQALQSIEALRKEVICDLGELVTKAWEG